MVILLCGVESVDPLLELVPLKGESCLQISSEQEPQEYCSAVTEIVHRGEEIWETEKVTGVETMAEGLNPRGLNYYPLEQNP